MATAATTAATTGPQTDNGRAYAGYVLFVLILVNMMNSVDRAVVNILVEPIRKDLGFTDTQIGLISGLGFALVFGLLGLPIARLADRGNRKVLLAAGLAAWSTMTIVTGRAVGFWSMLVARFGVGAGEATCYPASLSLIADYFKPEHRPRAIALFQIGLHLGFIVGAGVASTIAERYGWRAAFTVLGLPGVVLAGILLLTVREPARGRLDVTNDRRGEGAGFGEALRLLVADRPFVIMVLAGLFMALGGASLANWGAAYMMRSHGLTQGQVGVVLGPVMGIGGLVGTLAGGFLGTMIAKRNPRPHAPLLVMLFTALPGVPAMILFLLAPSVPLAVIGGLFGGVLTSMHYGSLVAVALNRVPSVRRGMASSLVILGQTVIGFGLGPLIVGAISDGLSGSLGTESLRYAMLMAPVAVLVGWSLALLAWRRLESAPQSAA
ncbi:MFS transporter [Sphingomonas sp.]|jgi:predicted MFS family arabinose efflux permease|uniref:spinster family MFS transporter n=1 Tax=Sphingomonas sp. TaxID=28214 RepID=UPI002D7F9D1E|nr:MFS transporter [Sphingomonas sp.]HEU0044486.1 MFS transporter [Sphingomonas sp.]